MPQVQKSGRVTKFTATRIAKIKTNNGTLSAPVGTKGYGLLYRGASILVKVMERTGRPDELVEIIRTL